MKKYPSYADLSQALDAGIDASHLENGTFTWITFNGERLYCGVSEIDRTYYLSAVPESEMIASRNLTVGVILFIFFSVAAIVALYGLFVIREDEKRGYNPENFKTIGPLRYNKAVGRKAIILSFVGFLLVALVVFLGVIFKDAVFPDDSAFAYVLNGGWEYGLNVFALTAVVMIVCVVSTITVAIQKLLHMLAGVFGARGETMCRLLSSFIKYATIIGMVYYCLMLIGIDTTTLLASAGILSIAITFGAKEPVSDILSGLFIIFEGEFRVGDVIQVGAFNGTVMEIGIRTTKINDGSGNVVIIRNSQVSNVTNMTKESSYTSVDMDIEYGESLERVESILQDEFPNIRRRLPAIEDGPFYKGVVSLADNSVTIRVVVMCDENDRGQLTRDLRREMKLIFDEHEIQIPFSQVVVHQPAEYKKATISEQLRADRFNDDQKLLHVMLATKQPQASKG